MYNVEMSERRKLRASWLILNQFFSKIIFFLFKIATNKNTDYFN